MAGFGNIADLSVGLELNDRGFTSELRAAEARVAETVRRIDSMRGEAEIGADLDELNRDMARAEALLAKWRNKRAEATLDVDVKRAETQVKRFETQLNKLRRRKVVIEAELRGRQQAERDLAGIARRLADTRREADHSRHSLLGLAQAFARTSVHLGPFTTRMSNMLRILFLLAPAVVSVAGALGALASVASTGLIGALGVATASLTGFALAAGGIALALRPLADDFDAARKAADAYNNAVLKYGRDSEQAAKKATEFRQVLRGVSDEGRQGFLIMDRLGDAFIRRTAPTRESALELLGLGARAGGRLLPTFTRRINEAAAIAEREFARVIRQLGSRRGRTFLDGLMGDFNRALPGMLRAMTELAAAGAKLTRAFMGDRALGRVVDRFSQWAENVNRAASNTDRLNNFAERMTTAFLDVVHLFTGAGRVLTQFFRAGLEPGTRAVRDLADRLHDLADAMSTVEGQARIRDFFERSFDTVRRLWRVIGPLVTAFFRFADAMRPVSNLVLDVVGALSQLLDTVLQLKGIGPVLNAVLGFSILRSLPILGRRIRGVESLALTAGAALVPGAAGAALQRTAARRAAARGIGAGATAAIAGASGAAGQAATTRVGGLTRAMQGLRTAFMVSPGPAKVVTGALLAVGAGAITAAAKIKTYNERMGELREQQDAAFRNTTTLQESMADVGSATTRSELNLRALRRRVRETKEGTIEHEMALLDYRDALRQALAQEQEWQRVVRETKRNTDAEVQAIRERIKAERERRDAIRPSRFGGDASRRQAESDRRLLVLQGELNRALNRRAAATHNLNRALAGLAPLAGRAEQRLGRLARTSEQVADRVATQFASPEAAGRVAEAARRALRAGVSERRVIQVIVNSRNAEEAFRRLNAIRLRPKIQEVRENGGAGVISLLRQIGFVRLAAKVQRVSEQGGPAVLAMLNRIDSKEFRTKLARIVGRDMASAIIAAIQARLNSLPASRTVVLRTIHESIHRVRREGGRGVTLGSGLAHGRGPTGKAEMALVGEGRRHEFVVNPVTGKFQRVSQPTIMRLDPEDYVIPTEPAFRERGRALLRELALDLGIPAFQRGRRRRRRPSRLSAGERRAEQRRVDRLPVPDRIRFGAVDESEQEREVDQAREHYQERVRSIEKRERQLTRQRRSLNDAKTDDSKKKWRREIRKTKNEIRQLRTGAGMGGGSSLRELFRNWLRERRELRELRETNRTIERLNIEQETLRQVMENASRKNDRREWVSARNRRRTVLEQLERLFSRATRLARPNSIIGANLAQQLASVQSALIDTDEAAFGPDAEPPEPPSLETFLTSLGALQAREQLEANLAVAEATTPTDPNDDRAAAQSLVQFYESVLRQAQLQGQPPTVIREAAEELSAARSQLTSLLEPTADEEAISEQLRERLHIAQQEAAINAAFAEAAGGFAAGQLRSSPFSSVGPTVQQNIYTLHPGDPATLSAIGAAASAGIGFQGFRPSSRHFSGY